MQKRRIGEIILVGVAAVVFFATISKGASFGPKAQAQDKDTKQKSKTIELTGVLEKISEGKHDLNIEIFTDASLTEPLFSREFRGVDINEGFYTLKINTQEAGLETGRSYGLRITVLGEEGIPVTEAKLEIVAEQTLFAFEGEEGGGGITAQQYNLTGNYPYPQAVVTVTNSGTGYGIKSVSKKGVGLYAESQAAQGYGLHAKNTVAGGTALLAEGKAKVQGDLEVTGLTSLTSVNLPANSVGTSQITDGSVGSADLASNSVGTAKIADGTIVDADISPTAAIAAGKIAAGPGSGLDADKLDGKDSTEFAVLDANGNMQVPGNLAVNGTGNSYVLGRLGIGTTGPGYHLDVQGYNTAEFGSEATLRILSTHGIGEDASRTGILFAGANRPGGFAGIAASGSDASSGNGQLRFFTAFGGALSERVRIDTLGKMGIGTSTPEYQLHLQRNSAGADGIIIENTSSDDLTNQPAEIVFKRSGLGAAQRAAVGVDSTARDFFIWVNGQDRLNINQDGNVGIGTAGPGYHLDVQGYNTAEFGSEATLRILSTHGIGEDVSRTGILFAGANRPGGFAGIAASGSDASSGNGQLRFFTALGGALSERVRIDTWGKMGIGTTGPGYHLDIQGYNIAEFGPEATLRILSTHGVDEDVSRTGILFAGANRPGGFAGIAASGSDFNSGNGQLRFFTALGGALSERVRIDTWGKMGIGTTTPGAKLDVVGARSNIIGTGTAVAKVGGGDVFLYTGALDEVSYAIWMQAMRTSDSVVFPLALQPNGGNVGIGTTTPQAKLHVAGDTKVTGTITTKEIIVTQNVGADFVFAKDYNLRPLDDVEQFIQKKGHLPEIPSAEEMQSNGVNVSDMQSKLLQKVEELTLYVIAQDKKIKELEEQLESK